MATYYTIYFHGTTNDAWGYPESITYESGSAVQIPTHTPARTGYDFLRWNTSIDGSGGWYYPGDYLRVSDKSRNLYLYAFWTKKTFTVSYNLNGGSGTVADQTKHYDEPLTLVSSIPTRSNYVFKGWGVSAASTTATYAAGGSYQNNADITLYAVWEKGYENPRVTNMSIYRCNSSGSSNDNGTYFKVSFSWVADLTVSSIVVKWRLSTATTWTSKSFSASGTSGNFSSVLGSGGLSAENTYIVVVEVSDSNGTTSISGRVGAKNYIIDFPPKGCKGVAFGKPSEENGLFEVEWDAKFNGKINIENVSQIPVVKGLFDSINNTLGGLLDKMYPVNSIYLSYSHTSPATLFGGTWTRLSPYYIYATSELGVIGETFWWWQPDYKEESGGNVQAIKIAAWRRIA